MNRTIIGLFGAVLLSSAPYGVEAADLMAPHPVVPYQSTEAEPAVASGWYLRGDIGIGVNAVNRFTEQDIDNPAANQTTGWLKKSIGDSAVFDVGLGYQFNDYLRGDITAQYRAATGFHSTDITTNTLTNENVQNLIDGNVSSTVLMANAYWDITHWNGLTPFVGAGIGAAYNKTTGVHGIAPNNFTPPNTMVGVFDDQGKWNVAYALHAGVSWDVNSRLKLEAAYTFQDLGGAKLLESACYNGTSCATFVPEQYAIKKITTSDFRIGARWLFDAPAAPSYVSYPVVAKN
ncbi:MAG: outer membrane beta-barrel protein [Ancalomicrobiaceae bacterium]|nr:outer membrane beta-barrel protein [Ancalomicrobiaceae bacterium]